MVSDLFLSAAYQSLRLCSFLSAPTLQTIHCQLLIGSYLLNTERAASFWPLLGSVARQAQSIGLHVDPYKIRRDWDAVEADTRRRLWWAAVHQDAILSSIFGRPLGITRFSCRFPAPPAPGTVTYARLQCEFSQFARTYLDENQENSWSQAQVIEYTERVLQWYMNIPERYRPDLGRIDLLGSEGDAEAIQNYRAAGVDLKTKGLMEVHQSGNLAVEVFYVLMSLHRSNLYSHEEKEEGRREINETSLHICAQALRRITRAQQTMIDLLGRARATMFWKIAYYTYQAAIAGAYIVFVRPQSKHAQSALEDLAVLVDFFDRMPERWTGLKMAKHGLRVLRKLAVAARETPEAASMAVRTPQPEVEPQAPVQEPEPSADISPSALFPSASGVEFSSHSGFLPPIFTTAYQQRQQLHPRDSPMFRSSRSSTTPTTSRAPRLRRDSSATTPSSPTPHRWIRPKHRGGHPTHRFRHRTGGRTTQPQGPRQLLVRVLFAPTRLGPSHRAGLNRPRTLGTESRPGVFQSIACLCEWLRSGGGGA